MAVNVIVASAAPSPVMNPSPDVDDNVSRPLETDCVSFTAADRIRIRDADRISIGAGEVQAHAFRRRLRGGTVFIGGRVRIQLGVRLNENAVRIARAVAVPPEEQRVPAPRGGGGLLIHGVVAVTRNSPPSVAPAAVNA